MPRTATRAAALCQWPAQLPTWPHAVGCHARIARDAAVMPAPYLGGSWLCLYATTFPTLRFIPATCALPPANCASNHSPRVLDVAVWMTFGTAHLTFYTALAYAVRYYLPFTTATALPTRHAATLPRCRCAALPCVRYLPPLPMPRGIRLLVAEPAAAIRCKGVSRRPAGGCGFAPLPPPAAVMIVCATMPQRRLP